MNFFQFCRYLRQETERQQLAAVREPQGDCCLRTETNCGDSLCPLPAATPAPAKEPR